MTQANDVLKRRKYSGLGKRKEERGEEQGCL